MDSEKTQEMGDSPVELKPFEIPQPFVFRNTKIFIVVVLAMMSVIAIWMWQKFPADSKIPMHWDLHGNPDRYGGKFETLLAIPLSCLAINTFFYLITKVFRRGNVKNMRVVQKPYNLIIKFFSGILLLVYLLIIAISFGFDWNINAIILGLVAVFVVGLLGVVFSTAIKAGSP